MTKKNKTYSIDLDLVIKILLILVLVLGLITIILFLIKKVLPAEKPALILPSQPLSSLKPSPSQTPKKTQTKPSPQPSYQPKTTSEKEEILDAAYRYVQSHSAPDQKFSLTLSSQVKKNRDEYALVQVDPIPAGSAEGAGVVLQKIGGLWIVMDMGTLLMDWHEQVPELFNF